GAGAHQHELHGARAEVAPAHVGRRIDHDGVAAAAFGHEGHALHQLHARLHFLSSTTAARSSAASTSSHVLTRFQATASSAGPTKRPMKPKATAPPNTPSTTSSMERLPARLIRIGLMKLSTELITATP